MQPMNASSTIDTSTDSTAFSSKSARLEKLRQIAREGGYDAIALVPGPTLLYLTGVSYHLSERPILAFIPPQGDAALIVPQLEFQKMVDAEPFAVRSFTYTDTDGYLTAFDQACRALGLSGKRVGVEGLKMRVLEGQLIERYAPGCTVDAADDSIIAIRLHKEPGEIAAMRKAIAVSERALESILPKIRIGMTEQQVKNLLLNAMAEFGSGGNAFEPIVLGGPNSALPHGVPSDRPLQRGDLLLFDYGTAFDGYPADITRTFAVDEIDDELKKIYELVRAANAAGVRAIRPGVTAQEVDRAARKVINDGGYGKYFIHRLGHGLGLDVHESPNILEGSSQVLEPGMCFTVEPGIYLPGKGGVRIEDNVVVTQSGVEVLTTFPRELRSVGQ
jgi:Xaa-Pro aminopeptidase